jgi:hypothetical protein
VISKIWQIFPHKETKFVRKSLLYMPVETSFDFSHAKNLKRYGILYIKANMVSICGDKQGRAGQGRHPPTAGHF